MGSDLGFVQLLESTRNLWKCTKMRRGTWNCAIMAEASRSSHEEKIGCGGLRGLDLLRRSSEKPFRNNRALRCPSRTRAVRWPRLSLQPAPPIKPPPVPKIAVPRNCQLPKRPRASERPNQEARRCLVSNPLRRSRGDGPVCARATIRAAPNAPTLDASPAPPPPSPQVLSLPTRSPGRSREESGYRPRLSWQPHSRSTMRGLRSATFPIE